MIDICICTHNPRPALLASVIDSLAVQDAASEVFRVTVIDNASQPPLHEDILQPLRARGVDSHLLAEGKTGLVHARLRAIAATDGAWILFVDDDNVLTPNFLTEGLRFIAMHPEVGCFGGRLILPDDVPVPAGREPFLPFLGIRDLGDEARVGRSAVWVEHEPPGAGAFVKREVLQRFEALAREHLEVFTLGRSGGSLASCDDSLLMSCANDVGLAVAYDPALRLQHHIAPERLERRYLRRLMRAYGESQVALLLARGREVSPPRYYASLPAFVLLLCVSFAKNLTRSIDFAVAQICYHLGARSAYLAAAR